MKKTRSLKIHLKNEKSSCVHKMLSYLYTQNFKNICLNKTKMKFEKKNQLQKINLQYRRTMTHFVIYVLIDKYDIIKFKPYVQNRFLNLFVKINDLDELDQTVQKM